MTKIHVRLISFIVLFSVTSLVVLFLARLQIAVALLTLVLSSIPLFCAIVCLFGEIDIEE